MYDQALKDYMEEYILLSMTSVFTEEPNVNTQAIANIHAMEQQISQKEMEARKIGKPYALEQVIRAYGLSDLERFVLLYLYLETSNISIVKQTEGLETSFVQTKASTILNIVELYRLAHPVTDREVAETIAATGILCTNLLEEVKSKNSVGNNIFIIKRYVYEYLQGYCGVSKELNRMVEKVVPSQAIEPLYIREIFLTKLLRLYEERPVCVNLYGQEGMGRSFLVRHLGQALQKTIFYLDVRKLMLYSLPDLHQLLLELLFSIKLQEGILCLKHLNVWTGENGKPIEETGRIKQQSILEYMEEAGTFSLLLSDEKTNVTAQSRLQCICLELPELSVKERYQIWKEACKHFKLEADIDLVDCANKYIFTPKEIKQVVCTASYYAAIRDTQKKYICQEDLLLAVKQETKNVFGGYAVRIQAEFTFDDLVVSDMTKKQMQMVCNQIRYRDIVGEEWGFFRKMPYGRAISVLFYGVPGTGKTMAAQVLSNELGLDLYRIDSSQLISKYIGETEKNVSELFLKAKSLNAILFFDEADALFARRSEVSDANDRNANAETAHLLQQFEEYDGIVILATNYLNNLDYAFKRRIRFMIGFELPSVDMRQLLWEKNLPTEATIKESINFEYFARRYELAGSDIKEILLNAAFFAVSEEIGIGNRHIEEMVWLNYQKKGKLLSREECLFLQ